MDSTKDAWIQDADCLKLNFCCVHRLQLRIGGPMCIWESPKAFPVSNLFFVCYESFRCLKFSEAGHCEQQSVIIFVA